MADRERTMSPPIISQISNAAKSTARSSLSPLRQRALGRAATFAESQYPLRKRRSSTFSDSAQSFKSSTDDLLLPRAKSADDVVSSHEPSHWHSVPLALALLPAAGGLFWENGSAVITDVTLLSLAAIFLNWSVRLPWDWYQSAQEIQVQDQDTYPPRNDFPSDTIVEEGSDEEASQPSQPTSPPADSTSNSPAPTSQPAPPQSSASNELRIHEILALLTCFIGPLIGAWLLHHIRAQLSRPSEGLVSNYNLTIFLLASELRPLSHLLKLVQARTLHLQRVVATNPYTTTSQESPENLQDFTHRLAELEAHVADTSPNVTAGRQQDLTTQARKSLQPDLDALNRAVRRYEKRATLLSLQTESRLQDLESRMSDAITLAAAAERSSQSNKQRRGSGVYMVVDWIAAAMLLPMQIFLAIMAIPGKAIGAVLAEVEIFAGGVMRRQMSTESKEGRGSGSSSEKRRPSGRGQKKAL